MQFVRRNYQVITSQLGHFLHTPSFIWVCVYYTGFSKNLKEDTIEIIKKIYHNLSGNLFCVATLIRIVQCAKGLQPFKKATQH